MYEKLRQVGGRSSQGRDLQLIAKLGIGMTAGAVGQLAAVPADVIKVSPIAQGAVLDTSPYCSYSRLVWPATNITSCKRYRAA